MSAERYYTLVASLPRLPHFERAEWLPLSRKELDTRLTMLSPDHARQLKLAEDLVQWQRQPVERTDRQVADNYKRVIPELGEPALREFVEYRMTQRTALAALRRRRRGLGPPQAGVTWGVGVWVERIVSAWDRRDLAITPVLPWIEEADRLLESNDARALERLLMDAVWNRLGRFGERSVFGFEPVMAFVFRLDILQRWLSYDAEAARSRFQDLVLEVTRDHQQLFA